MNLIMVPIDMQSSSNSNELISGLKFVLSSKLQVMFTANIEPFIGWERNWSAHGISIAAKLYIKRFLHSQNMEHVISVDTTLPPKYDLSL